MSDKQALYAASLPFVEVRGDQVVFGGAPEGMTWGGDHPEHRAIAGSEFVIDKRYWELCGSPDKLVVGFANEDGWNEWVGPVPSNDLGWMEPTGTAKD